MRPSEMETAPFPLLGPGDTPLLLSSGEPVTRERARHYHPLGMLVPLTLLLLAVWTAPGVDGFSPPPPPVAVAPRKVLLPVEEVVVLRQEVPLPVALETAAAVEIDETARDHATTPMEPLDLLVGTTQVRIDDQALRQLGAGTVLPTSEILTGILREQLAPVLATLETAPIEAQIGVDERGNTPLLIPGTSGQQAEISAVIAAIRSRLRVVTLGNEQTLPIEIPLQVLEPDVDEQWLGEMVSRMEVLGSYTVNFDRRDQAAANIRIPAERLEGLLIPAGAWFDFWEEVGPVTYARGYRVGSAFINGKYQARGALGGGICAASTALYVAAARAGLELGERHPHSAYIESYPLGLDAAVGGSGARADTMRFRNDTSGPLLLITQVIDGYRQRFEIWGVNDGRTTEIKTGTFWGAKKGTAGFWGGRVTVERVVRDRNGVVIHLDSISSGYSPR